VTLLWLNLVVCIKVGIFGCGWLGRALVKTLQHEYTVYGAVRSLTSSARLEQEHIKAFCLPQTGSEFWNIEILVIAIPPRHQYLETLTEIANNMTAKTQQIILLSTTSVYKEDKGLINEMSEVDPTKLSVQGELLFKKIFSKGSIIRLGGLMGDDRIAGQWGSKVLSDSRVNYLHQRDAVGIIEAVIKQKISDDVINAVSPDHPKRSKIYKMNCKRFGWELPTFTKGEEKIILSVKSENLLGYHYVFKDPMYFWADI